MKFYSCGSCAQSYRGYGQDRTIEAASFTPVYTQFPRRDSTGEEAMSPGKTVLVVGGLVGLIFTMVYLIRK